MKKDMFPQGEDYSIPTDALPERASFFTAGDDGEIFVPKPAVNLPALKEKRVYVSCETGVHNMGSDFFEEHEENGEKGISLKEGKEAEDLIQQFRGYLALDVLLAFVNQRSVQVLGV